MKIALGSDHAGFGTKQSLAGFLKSAGHDVEDLGTDSSESVDYPDFAKAVAKAVANGSAEKGILICGTGIGMSMSANKVKGVRAALCHSAYTAEMSRRHNDANVLCLGGRILAEAAIERIAERFLATPFEGGRHQARVSKIMDIGSG
jgi:ribose 5-phosphate isomerase B